MKLTKAQMINMKELLLALREEEVRLTFHQRGNLSLEEEMSNRNELQLVVKAIHSLDELLGKSELLTHSLDPYQAKIQELRQLVWGYDIPSSTCPEYIEHHQSIQAILKFIDTNLINWR